MSRAAAIGWCVAYAVMIVAILVGMFTLRERTLSAFDDNKQVLEQWQDWRDEAAREAKEGPVRRRVPASREPPSLVLMRDYFFTMLSGAVLFSSLLFGTVMLVMRGIFGRSASSPQPSSARGEGAGQAR